MLGRVTIGLGLLGLLGLATGQPPQGNTEIDAIRLAVFRQQLGFWLDGHARESKTVVCLAIEDGGVRRSVTKEYLRHFPGEAAVRTGDDCDKRPSGAVERSTTRPAVLVASGEVAWQSPDEAWVTTSHYRSAMVSGVRKQRVVRENGRWICLGQIIKDTPL
jgi:hypothetical protein